MSPVAGTSNTQRIAAVVLGGRYLDRRALDELLKLAEEKARDAADEGHRGSAVASIIDMHLHAYGAESPAMDEGVMR